jgi:hypothetical protein
VRRTQQRLELRRGQYELEELGHEHLVQDLITVLGQRGGKPVVIVGIEASEPAEELVVVQLSYCFADAFGYNIRLEQML